MGARPVKQWLSLPRQLAEAGTGPRCVLFVRRDCMPASVSPLPVVRACLLLNMAHLLLLSRGPSHLPGEQRLGARRSVPPVPVRCLRPPEALSAHLLREKVVSLLVLTRRIAAGAAWRGTQGDTHRHMRDSGRGVRMSLLRGTRVLGPQSS